MTRDPEAKPDAQPNEKYSPRKCENPTTIVEDVTDDKTKDNGQLKLSAWQKLNPLRWQKIPPLPSQRQVSREYRASVLSIIFFDWVSPLIKTGYLRDLDERDIWSVNPNRSIHALSGKLELAFKHRVENRYKKPLYWALYDVFKFELWTSMAYGARERGDPMPSISSGMGYAVGIFLIICLNAVCTNHAFYWGQMAGDQIKAALTSMIFSKTMKLSSRARIDGLFVQEGGKGPLSADVDKGWSNGRIVTLMSVDLARIARSCGTLHVLGATVTALTVVLIILVIMIGYSALSGYGYAVIAVLCTAGAMRYLVRSRRRLNGITDQRVSLTQEILQNVRFMKFFGWESSFLGRFRDIRAREIRSLHRVVMIKHTITVSLMSVTALASMLSFITYALTGHSLTPDRIFASLGAFNALRSPFNLINMTLSQAADAWEGVSRVQSFLMAEEREDYIEWDFGMEKAIDLQHASFTWEVATTPNVEEHKSRTSITTTRTSQVKPSLPNGETENVAFNLPDLNLTLGRHELVAIIGAVGCGKSSLLGALASDMRLISGSARLGASRAFCPQIAWIQNATVRNNILFGQEYDEDRYNQVVNACALQSDFAMLPDGDHTEVGERGITLSGGQKQRVNIARAVYSNSEIVLMDDPLSAVDAHVGRQLMDQVVCGLLKGRCRVLATHQLHVLKRCDRIIVMEEGQIQAIDTFDNLIETDELFQRLMSKITTDEQGSRVSPMINEIESVPTKAVGDASKNNTRKPALMQKEEIAAGSVGWTVWKTYIKSTGSILNFFVSIALALTSTGCLVMSGLWLSYWTSNKYPNLGVTQYAGIYAGISITQVVIMYLFSLHMNIVGSISSNNMLIRAMKRVLRAPVSFFDTTPLGRITNRFTSDVSVLDEDLADNMRVFVYSITIVASTAALATAFFHYFAIVAAMVVAFSILLVRYSRPCSRRLRRQEAVLRSVVFARFSEAIVGVSTIQAYKIEAHFQRTFHEAIDSLTGVSFLATADLRWVGIRIDLASSLLILTIACLVASSQFNATPSTSGLVLSQFGQSQTGMNSVQRLHHYGDNLEQEPPLHQKDVPPSWPEKGQITFTNAQMRYRDGLPLVLQGLSMEIRGGERIGIVGRTGAGKSSIMATLFRFVDLCGGSIVIDDIDIATVGVQDLRTRMAIIPQDPTLFKGTIRSNLDPFNEHTDLEMWSALRKAHLIGQELPGESQSLTDNNDDEATTHNEKSTTPPSAQPRPLHLDTSVEEGGENFSLGQRQLMALARALVRDSRIIICDEATSSVDLETDTKVQETIAHGFHGRTLLCIAHRLRTILKYDRICVMDHGKIAEMDAPLTLWEARGVFRGMCDQSGITREDFGL
ncbi:hypothetical protein FE257_005148 [Aspergillus nanangensis]|uniref:P-loop containing nucleoside triphosphate hydrolase protein n=1 Tax=Aspergillus nanangensis TaxID=2582783 RepID=A0AAD4CAE0_ASPNN|nr:hypothetical protein FE257_005148 [Aspergillus nanangensis]